MNNYIKILLIVIFFSGCSVLDIEKNSSNVFEEIDLNQNMLDKNYIGMTRRQIIYIFGMPIISDSFNDVYHYYLYDSKNNNTSQKKILNLYFKNNKVFKFNIR